MRKRAIPAALWLCLCAMGQETAAVNGVVVNARTGEPLAGVQVHFGVHTPDAGLTFRYGALTGKDGRFSVAAVHPDTYFVMVQRYGFVATAPAPPLVTLTAGQHMDELRIEMTARALISGRVTDEAGDPLAKALIQAESASGDDMLLTLNALGVASTDDRGQYRMSIPPGKYRIYAHVPAEPSDEPAEIRTDGTTASVNPLTFYPSAAARGGAVAVEAVSGRETSGIDIRMAHPITLNLSGAVTGAPAGVTAMVNVNAVVRQGNRIYDIPAPDGGFVVPNLEQGTYYLYAFTSAEPKLRSAVAEFSLTDSGVSGIELALRPSFEITGALEMAEGAGSPANRVIRLEMMTGHYGDSRIGAVGSDGAFQVRGVDPERYRVVVRPLPENGYVKAVWMDGVLMPHGVLDLRKGGAGSRLKILAATDSAQVSGKVEGARGLEYVVLLAEGDPDGDNSRDARTASDGSFTIKSVPPGTYRIIALEMSRSYDESMADGAELLDIQPNDRLTRNLKLVTEARHEKK
jgi:hypothetical protein